MKNQSDWLEVYCPECGLPLTVERLEMDMGKTNVITSGCNCKAGYALRGRLTAVGIPGELYFDGNDAEQVYGIDRGIQEIKRIQDENRRLLVALADLRANLNGLRRSAIFAQDESLAAVLGEIIGRVDVIAQESEYDIQL